MEGTERGYVRQFYSTVKGAEVCGPEFTPDNTTLFVAIQHPGEGGTFEKPISNFPDGGTLPRPSVVAIQATNGGRIGQATPAVLPQSGGELPETAAIAAAGAGAALLALGAVLRRRMNARQDEPAR